MRVFPRLATYAILAQVHERSFFLASHRQGKNIGILPDTRPLARPDSAHGIVEGIVGKGPFFKSKVLFSKPSRVYSRNPPKSRADGHRASQPLACHVLPASSQPFADVTIS